MPPKGYQSLGDALVPVGTRIPKAWLERIAAHAHRLHQQNPDGGISQSIALRSLIRLGLELVESERPAAQSTAARCPDALPVAERTLRKAQRPQRAATARQEEEQRQADAAGVGIPDAIPNPEKRLTETIPAYDPTKYVLGQLCPRGHDYYGSGQTLLRLPGRSCPACAKAGKRDRRAERAKTQ